MAFTQLRERLPPFFPMNTIIVCLNIILEKCWKLLISMCQPAASYCVPGSVQDIVLLDRLIIREKFINGEESLEEMVASGWPPNPA